MCYQKFTEVYGYVIQYSCRATMNYEFSLDNFSKPYQYHLQILRTPFKRPAVLQVPANILTF